MEVQKFKNSFLPFLRFLTGGGCRGGPCITLLHTTQWALHMTGRGKKTFTVRSWLIFFMSLLLLSSLNHKLGLHIFDCYKFTGILFYSLKKFHRYVLTFTLKYWLHFTIRYSVADKILIIVSLIQIQVNIFPLSSTQYKFCFRQFYITHIERNIAKKKYKMISYFTSELQVQHVRWRNVYVLCISLNTLSWNSAIFSGNCSILK